MPSETTARPLTQSHDCSSRSEFTNLPSQVGLVFIVAATVVLLAWVLSCCDSGIDLTDEGYYLNWISQPELYPASHTQFGFIYKPLYRVLGGDLVLLRQANLLLIIGLSWTFFLGIILTMVRPSSFAASLPWVGLAFALSSTGLAVFHYWLPTPNYNTLALQGLLVGSIAIVWIINLPPSAFRGWFLLGVAGWILFMAKPTSALAAGLLFFVTLLLLRRVKLWPVAIALATVILMLLVSAWIIDSSIPQFISRLREGAADLERLQGKYSFTDIVRLDSFDLRQGEFVTLLCTTTFVFGGTYLALSASRSVLVISAGLALVGGLVLSAVLGMFYVYNVSPLNLFGRDVTPAIRYTPTSDWISNFPFISLQLSALPIGALLAFAARLPRQIDIREMALPVCLLTLPYAYVIGTNNNYWSGFGGAAVFWVAAAVVLICSQRGGRHWVNLLPFAIAAVAGTSVIIGISTDAPYRQPQALQENNTMVKAGATRLRVSDETAAYLNAIRRLVGNHGFRRGEPMIDLTGRSPTVLYLMGAKAVGLAWLSGGYRGSATMISTALDRLPSHQIRGCWVLDEPNGRRKVSPDILNRYGLDLERDYVVVGTVRTPSADYQESFTQRILKPKSRNGFSR